MVEQLETAEISPRAPEKTTKTLLEEAYADYLKSQMKIGDRRTTLFEASIKKIERKAELKANLERLVRAATNLEGRPLDPIYLHSTPPLKGDDTRGYTSIGERFFLPQELAVILAPRVNRKRHFWDKPTPSPDLQERVDIPEDQWANSQEATYIIGTSILKAVGIPIEDINRITRPVRLASLQPSPTQ